MGAPVVQTLDKPSKVYFFGTCLMDTLYPEAGLSAMRLLKRAGVDVVFPQAQSCCGQPARNSGYAPDALEVATKQLNAFPNDWPIIVASGSCAGMMRLHYPQMFAGTADEDRAKAFANRVYELSWFLIHVLKIELQDSGPPVKVAFHTSCSSRREMQVVEEPLQLLSQLTNVTLVPIAREAECCGFGGTFSIKQPQISSAMVTDKMNSVVESGAEVLLSGDCGCLMNIGGALEKTGHPIRPVHLAQFLWERSHER
jgi:L-lactate dehydrogenase complex protein LldE